MTTPTVDYQLERWARRIIDVILNAPDYSDMKFTHKVWEYRVSQPWDRRPFDKVEQTGPASWKFWFNMPGGAPGDDGSFIEIFDVRPLAGHRPGITFGEPELLSKTREDEVVAHVSNRGRSPEEISYRYRTGVSTTADHDVGVSLMVGLEAKLGNEATFASATAKTEITTSFSEHWSQGREAEHEVTVSGAVEPGMEKIVTNSVERGKFKQVNRAVGFVDFGIHLHSYWWYDWRWECLADFADTWSGHGKDFWGLEHNIVQTSRERPVPADRIARVREHPSVAYEDAVTVDHSLWMDLSVVENEILRHE